MEKNTCSNEICTLQVPWTGYLNVNNLSISIYINKNFIFISVEKKKSIVTQTDFAARKNTDSSGENIYAKKSFVSKKEKNVLI